MKNQLVRIVSSSNGRASCFRLDVVTVQEKKRRREEEFNLVGNTGVHHGYYQEKSEWLVARCNERDIYDEFVQEHAAGDGS